MGRGRNKGGGAGGTGAVEPKEIPTGGIIPTPGAEEAAPIPAPVAVAPEERNATPEELREAVFNTQPADRENFAIDAPSVNRPFEPGGMMNAWNNTSAEQLANGLINNVPLDTALDRMYRLPTPREVYDIPTPERQPPAKKALDQIAEVLSGAATAITDGYSAFREQLGLNGIPSATSNRVRVGRDTRRMVNRVAELATGELPGIERLGPEQRAQVTAILDAIGGLSLTRERMYEVMILTRGGRETAKGRVMKQANDRIIAEARRLSMEINRIMGESTAPFRNLPNPNTAGYKAYMKLFSDPATSYDFTMRNHKAPLYANRGLESLNND